MSKKNARLTNRSRDVMTHLHNALHPLERQVVIELHNIYIYIGNKRIPAINLAAFQHRDGLDRISFTEFNSFSTWKDLSVERIVASKHIYMVIHGSRITLITLPTSVIDSRYSSVSSCM